MKTKLELLKENIKLLFEGDEDREVVSNFIQARRALDNQLSNFNNDGE